MTVLRGLTGLQDFHSKAHFEIRFDVLEMAEGRLIMVEIRLSCSRSAIIVKPYSTTRPIVADTKVSPMMEAHVTSRARST